MDCLNFYDFFKKIKEISGSKNQKEVADKLGFSPQAITDAKKKNKIPETWYGIVSEKFGVTKEELSLQYVNNIEEKATSTHSYLQPEAQGSNEILPGKQPEKDVFDQVMDEFFGLVKEWQVEENGRTIKTAINFIQEFPQRFEEMAEWQKKRKGKNFPYRIMEIKSANGNG